MEQHLKKILIIFASIGLIAFVANLLIDNPYTHRLVRLAINEKVKEHTHLMVDFKAVKVSLLPLGVDFYGLYVSSDEDTNAPLLTASHFKTQVSLWALFLGEMRLGLVESNDTEIVWPPPAEFKGFLKNPKPQSDEKLTWPLPQLPVDRIVLSNSKIYAEFPLGGAIPHAPSWLILSLVGLDFEADIDSSTAIDTKLNVRSVNAALDASSFLEDASIETNLEIKNKTLTAKKLNIASARLKATGTAFGEFKTEGPQNVIDSLLLSGNATVAGDLSILGSLLDIGNTYGPVKGNVALQLTLPFNDKQEASFNLIGEGKAEDARIDGFRLHNSWAQFEINEEVLRFPQLDIIIGEQSFGKGSGEIHFNDAIDYEFRAEPSGLRLIDLLEALEVSFDLVDTSISSPNVLIKGRGDPFVLNATATAQLTNITLPVTPYDQSRFPQSPACRVDLHLAVTSKLLDFSGTRGLCFQPERKQKLPMPKAETLEAPAGVSPASEVNVSGLIHFDKEKGLNLNIASSQVNLSLGEYFAQIPLSGSAKAKTRIYGPFEHVKVETEIEAENVTIQDAPFADITGVVTVDSDKVEWHQVKAQLKHGGILQAKQGSLTIDDPIVFKTAIKAQDVKKDSFSAILNGWAPNLPYATAISQLDGELEGPIFSPFAVTGRLSGTLEAGSFDEENLYDTLNFKLASDAHGIKIPQIEAHLGTLVVSGSIKHKRAFPFSHAEAEASSHPWVQLGLHPDDFFNIELAANDDGSQAPEASRDHLQKLPYIGEIMKEVQITGLVKLKASLSGPQGNVQGAFSGSVQQPSLLGSTLPALNLRGFIRKSKLDVLVEQGGSALEGRISMDLAEAGVPYDWFFNFNRIDLRAFGTEYFYRDPRNYAYLTADWQMRGKLADWWRSQGELNIRDLRANYVQEHAMSPKTLQLRQEQPVKLLFTKEGWHFDQDKELFLSGQHLQIRISVPESKPPERIAIKVESLVDLALAREFSSDIDTATGKVRLAAELSGPVDNPELVVELTDLKPNALTAATWSPLSFGLADIRPPFRNIRTRMFFRDGRLVIDSLTADKGGGSISASGGLSFSEDSETDSRLEITLNDAILIYPVAFLKSFEMQLSGNLTVTGKSPPYRITGDINVTRARSMKEVDIRDEIINALRRQSFTTSTISDQPMFLFDINVNASSTINIHNRNLQSVMSANLRISGTDLAPSVIGQIEVDKAKFSYKRDFQVIRGLVSFDDPIKPDPSLDILAASDVDAYRVYIAITGRASNPTLEFSVDPATRESGAAISKMEILILLSRGKLPEESHSIGESTSVAATSEAINLIMGQFEEPVEKLFDLSGQSVVRNVYIDTYPSEEGSPVPRINLPLDLGENFDIVFRADQSKTGAAAEYNVHDNITFSGGFEQTKASETTEQKKQTPAGGDANVNLKFRFSFD